MATRMPDIMFTDQGTYVYHNSYFSKKLANSAASRLRQRTGLKGKQVIVKPFVNPILPGATLPWPGTKDMTGREVAYGIYRLDRPR